MLFNACLCETRPPELALLPIQNKWSLWLAPNVHHHIGHWWRLASKKKNCVWWQQNTHKLSIILDQKQRSQIHARHRLQGIVRAWTQCECRFWLVQRYWQMTCSGLCLQYTSIFCCWLNTLWICHIANGS